MCIVMNSASDLNIYIYIYILKYNKKKVIKSQGSNTYFDTLECLLFYCLSNKQLVIQTNQILLQYIQKQSIKSLYQGTIRRKLLFSISATSDTWLLFVIPMESFVSLYGTFLEDFEMQREQRSHEQRRRHLEVSSTSGIAGSLPIKPLAQGVV